MYQPISLFVTREVKQNLKWGVYLGHPVVSNYLDLVLLNRSEKTICLLELTCSFERNSQAGNLRKSLKYTTLKTDLEENGYECFLVPFEVGAEVPFINQRNQTNSIFLQQ